MASLCKVLFVLSLAMNLIATTQGLPLPQWSWGVTALLAYLCYRNWTASQPRLAHNPGGKGEARPHYNRLKGMKR